MSADRFTVDPGTRALLHDLGIPVAHVLRRARLPAGTFAQGAVTMTVEEYYRFWEAVDAEAADADLAARLGRALSVEVFNPPIFAALCSADLRTAAERIAAFKPLIGPITMAVSDDDGELTISFGWPGDAEPPRALVLGELAFWAAMARIGTRREVSAARVTTRRGPERSATLAAYFGTPVLGGDGDAITFGAADAARPFLTQDEAMWRFFAPELRRRLAEIEVSASTADRVRAALHESLPAGQSSIQSVARQLLTSPRSLQRQLSAEGTSFQAVLTGTRERLARRYLADQSLTAAQIAFLLAYDDPNSFYRAFRQWTGTTPEAVRSAALAPV